MFWNLLTSSVITGLVGTAVMIVFLYLPVLWGGLYYDTLGAIGSIWTRPVDLRTRLIARSSCSRAASCSRCSTARSR